MNNVLNIIVLKDYGAWCSQWLEIFVNKSESELQKWNDKLQMLNMQWYILKNYWTTIYEVYEIQPQTMYVSCVGGPHCQRSSAYSCGLVRPGYYHTVAENGHLSNDLLLHFGEREPQG